MKTKIIAENETLSEPQPGEKVMTCFLDDNSELGQYFSKRDVELSKEFDIGPVDDESL